MRITRAMLRMMGLDPADARREGQRLEKLATRKDATERKSAADRKRFRRKIRNSCRHWGGQS